MRVVITRPQPASERTAAALRARGHDVLSAPLMKIEPINAVLGTDYAGLIVTSANVTLVLADHSQRERLRQLPVFAVGDRTAEEMRKIGFNVISAQGDVGDLSRLIAARKPDKGRSLLYLAGEDRAAELAIDGVVVETKVVYRARALPFLPALVATIKAGQVDAALHFSARSARNYVHGADVAAILPAAVVSLRHFCLSEQVSLPLKSAGAEKIAIAAEPNENALLDLLA